jgi:hypothetical protein
MTDRPILFSGPMVRAILEGRKTQTRRVIKQPLEIGETDKGRPWPFYPGYVAGGAYEGELADSPYGVPGDRLWVRETYSWATFETASGLDDWRGLIRYEADANTRYIYQCDAPVNVGMWPGAAIRKYEGKKRPSIFMPRWASRITLEITDVRVQRVQEISHYDAIAEGISECPIPADEEGPKRIGYMVGPDDGKSGLDVHAQDSFRKLWDSINAKRGFGWDKNPWVWALTFRRGA